MSTHPVIKRLDHLGLIAAFCHEIGLPRMIDAVIPKYSDHNVSHGDAVLAMLLNGLGFHSRTLHMFSDFLRPSLCLSYSPKTLKHTILLMMY